VVVPVLEQGPVLELEQVLLCWQLSVSVQAVVDSLSRQCRTLPSWICHWVHQRTQIHPPKWKRCCRMMSPMKIP
jgi:hypothetical protein